MVDAFSPTFSSDCCQICSPFREPWDTTMTGLPLRLSSLALWSLVLDLSCWRGGTQARRRRRTSSKVPKQMWRSYTWKDLQIGSVNPMQRTFLPHVLVRILTVFQSAVITGIRTILAAWKVAEFQNHLMERHKCCWSVLSGNRPILIRLRASDLLAWLAQRFWVCCQPQFRDLCSGEMHDCFEVSRFDQNGDCNWNVDTVPWVETALTWGEKVTLCIILSCLDERHRYPYEVVLTLETSWNQWVFQCAFWQSIELKSERVVSL